MKAGAAMVLVAGGTAAALVVRRAVLERVGPTGTAVSPVTLAPRPNLLLQLFRALGRPAGGEVTGVGLARAPQDVPGFGRGIDPIPIGPMTLLAPAALLAADPLAPDGGGPGGIGVAATGPGNTAPSDFTSGQFALATTQLGEGRPNPAYSANLPGVPALTALMSGNLLGFGAQLIANLVSFFTGDTATPASQARAGEALSTAAAKVLGLFGITVPSMGAPPTALAKSSLAVGAYFSNAELATVERGEVAAFGISELDQEVTDLARAIVRDPNLALELMGSGTLTGPPPGTHAIPGQRGFFTDFTLTPVDEQGRPFGAATGNAPRGSTNFASGPGNTAQPNINQPNLPATADPEIEFDGPTAPPAPPGLPAAPPAEGTPAGLPAGLGPAPSGIGPGTGTDPTGQDGSTPGPGPGPGQGGGIGSGEAGAPGSGGTGAGASPGD